MNSNFIRALSVLCFTVISVAQARPSNKKDFTIEVTARALIIQNEKLLLVSDDGNFWYTPGGKLEIEETLTECIIREVMEETGVQVEPLKMLFIEEFFDKEEKIHKVEIYFAAIIKSGQISASWKDQGGEVKFVNFFSIEEIRNVKSIAPKFLKDGEWINSGQNPYKGARSK